MSQPAVSKHLGVLKIAGLVRDRREGRQTYYRGRAKRLKAARQLDRRLQAPSGATGSMIWKLC